MAVPKRKISKARRDKRRNSHWKLDLPGMSKCPKCGEMKHCAQNAARLAAIINGREVVAVKEAVRHSNRIKRMGKAHAFLFFLKNPARTAQN